MKKLQNIQVLRILACLGVFGVHIGQRLEFSGGIAKIAAFGAWGVYLFFLISGFCAFVSLDKKAVNHVKCMEYWLGRVVRIMPVYYAIILYNYVLHSFVLKDVPPDPSSFGWLRYVLCISRIYQTGVGFWDNLSATWTISSFLCFYLFVPILYKFITNSKRALAWLTITCVLSEVFLLPEPIKMMPYFLFGIFVYFMVKEGKEYLFITGSICSILLYGIIFEAWTIIVWVLIFGILTVSTKSLEINKYYLKKIIDVLDEYSYAIYLVHAVVIEWYDRTKQIYGFWQHKAVAFLLIILCTTIGVYVAHKAVELPIHKLYSRCSSRRGNSDSK